MSVEFFECGVFMSVEFFECGVFLSVECGVDLFQTFPCEMGLAE